MGSCLSIGSDPCGEMTKIYDEKLIKAYEKDQSITKLLLLGTGNSGKSTIIKQITIIHRNGFNASERHEYVSVIRWNVIRGFQTLIQGSRTLFKEIDTVISDNCQEYAKMVSSIESKDPNITPEIRQAIEALWEDPAIVAVRERESQIPLEEALDYYMTRISDIVKPDYDPTYDDIVHSRTRTTGVYHLEFVHNNRKFQCVDVGGQRNERNKWISQFENTDAVLFIVACSEYDQVCREDMKTNRMEESLHLFYNICHSPFFSKTSFILFLNKTDLLAEKIQRVTPAYIFEDYDGGNDFQQALTYIQMKFERTFQQAREGIPYKKDEKPDLYTQFTCATEQDSIETAFMFCESIITKRNLFYSNVF